MLLTRETLFGAGIIKGRLWGPRRLKYDKKSDTFRDDESKFFVINIGICEPDGDTKTFSSISHDETNAWVEGARAMASFNGK